MQHMITAGILVNIKARLIMFPFRHFSQLIGLRAMKRSLNSPQFRPRALLCNTIRVAFLSRLMRVLRPILKVVYLILLMLGPELVLSKISTSMSRV